MKIKCPFCGSELELEGSVQVGQHMSCPSCNQVFAYGESVGAGPMAASSRDYSGDIAELNKTMQSILKELKSLEKFVQVITQNQYTSATSERLKKDREGGKLNTFKVMFAVVAALMLVLGLTRWNPFRINVNTEFTNGGVHFSNSGF